MLVKAEKLFDVPAVRKIPGQGGDFVTRASAAKTLKMVILWALAAALNIALARLVQAGAPGLERLGGDSKSGPVGHKVLLGQSLIVLAQRGRLAQGHQQIERSGLR